jgi:anti-sigma B factor antagonist
MTARPSSPRSALLVASEELDGGLRVIAIAGEIDMTTGPELERRLMRVLNDPCPRVVLDLSRTTFFDASLIRVLHSAERWLHSRSGRIAIACPSTWQRKVLGFAGLDGRVPIALSRPEAVSMLDGDIAAGKA